MSSSVSSMKTLKIQCLHHSMSYRYLECLHRYLEDLYVFKYLEVFIEVSSSLHLYLQVFIGIFNVIEDRYLQCLHRSTWMIFMKTFNDLHRKIIEDVFIGRHWSLHRYLQCLHEDIEVFIGIFKSSWRHWRYFDEVSFNVFIGIFKSSWSTLNDTDEDIEWSSSVSWSLHEVSSMSSWRHWR